LDLGVLHGLIEKSGAWFLIGDKKLGQGREAAKEYLKEHPDLIKKLIGQIKEQMKVDD